MNSTKETITVKRNDGEEVDLDIVFPSGKDYEEANIIYAAAWQKAASKGVLIEANLDDFLKQNGLWNPAIEKEREKIENKINELEKKLSTAGIKLEEGKKIAIEIFRKRQELREFDQKRINIKLQTAEALAENTKFNYFVSVCTLNNSDGSPYFKDYDDYQDRISTPEAMQAALKFATIYYANFDADPDANKKEIQFLRKYKLINEKGQLINKDGKAVDEHGRLINENGRYINENNEYVDINNNRVDENGMPISEEIGVFYDEEGNVVLPKE